VRLFTLLRLPALCRRFAHLPGPVFAGSLGAVIVLTLLAGFVPGRRGAELRLPLDLVPLPMPEQVAMRPLDTTPWMLRRSVSMQPVIPRHSTPSADEDGLLRFSAEGVSILTAEGPRWVRHNASGAVEDDLFHLLNRRSQSPSSDLLLMAAPVSGGRTAALCVPPPGSEAIRAEALRRAWRAGNASPYSVTIGTYADKFGLDRRLIYAIMYVESGFDSSRISNRGAHGLMQIVPDSAGHEVHTYLHGAPGQPDTASLLNPLINIEYGVTYLHLLLQRHLAGIKNPLSREYCAVAAYNSGSGSALKVFGASREEAFDAINSLTPIEVYAALTERLPAAETRAFLRKVILTKSGLALAGAELEHSGQEPL